MKHDKGTKQYKISAKALEKTDGIFLKSMLQLVQLHLNALWDFEESADIIVVDIEQPEGKTFWELHHLDKLLIAYARQNSYQAQWFLPKPIRVKPLVNLLNTLATFKKTNEITIASCSITPKGTVTVTESVSPIVNTETHEQEKNTTDSLEKSFNPSEYLLGLLQSCLKSEKIQRFTRGDLPALYVSPREQRCFTSPINMSDVTLAQKTLYSSLAQSIKVTLFSDEMLREAIEKYTLRAYPIETALWLATLYASQGRLMKGYSKESFFRLKSWPNFIVLPYLSVHVNMAAFMLKHTANLSMVADKTETPLTIVIDFFNACESIGLISSEKSPNVEDKNLPEHKRELFRTILKRLLR
jgi:hypothetical protein